MGAWMDPVGPRAARDEAFKGAMKAYEDGREASKAGEDPAEYYETANKHSKRFREASAAAIPERPTRGWLGLMCRGLGELLDVSMPSRDEFPEARRYRVLPYLTILVPIFFIISVSFVLPWAMLSPVTATGRAIGGNEGQIVTGQVVILALSLLVIGFFVFVGPKRVKMFLFEAALDEELWFRLGAESWLPGRRVRSCSQFGIAHFLNLIVAIATLGGLALVGGVFMWVYLREFRASGDPRQAAIVSAQFHATYNWGALMLLLASSLLAFVGFLLPLFL